MEDPTRAGWKSEDRQLWWAPRVERAVWRLADDRVVDCATYRVVGGQTEAFAEVRSFSDEWDEPVAVDLAGLTGSMRSGFLAFLDTTGLVPVEWIHEDVVLLRRRDDGGSGVREPRPDPVPARHLAAEAPLSE